MPLEPVIENVAEPVESVVNVEVICVPEPLRNGLIATLVLPPPTFQLAVKVAFGVKPDTVPVKVTEPPTGEVEGEALKVAVGVAAEVTVQPAVVTFGDTAVPFEVKVAPMVYEPTFRPALAATIGMVTVPEPDALTVTVPV